MTALLAAGAALAAAVSASSAAAGATDGRRALAPCRPPGIEETLRCGDLLVPEDPRRADGRKIKLHFVVVPALENAGAGVPLFDLAGGPGIPGSGAVGFYVTDGRIHRRTRDVVLVDQRGTGESSPLRCPELEQGSPLDRMYPPEAVRRCRQTLESYADLSQYTTANAAADLDAVRAALGYDRIDLLGLSYGTRLALEYLRTYPQHTRAAALMGTVADGKKLPLWHARNAQVALGRLFAQCAADPPCQAAFPDLARRWQALLASLEAKTPTVTTLVKGQPVTASLPRGPFAEAFRTFLVPASGQLRVPLLVHRMAQGDFAPFLADVLGRGHPFAEGLYLSVTCAEDTPLITPAERESATAGTFLGAYRVDEQAGACRQWKVPLAPVRPPAAEPDVPLLLIAGDMDAVTPPAWAREVAARFPRARLVEVPGLGHFPDGLENLGCLDEMIDAFLAGGGAAGLDTSCLARMKRPPFVLADPPAGR